MDAERFTELFTAHSASLILYARQWLGRAAAEDVVQDVFIRLMSQRKSPDNAKAWLFKVVRNEAISQTRSLFRRRKRERDEARDEWFEPTAGEDLDAAAAGEALQTLQPTQREVIVLRIWAGMSLKEIAAVVGLPVSTVFDNHRQGIGSIREKMGVICQNKTT